MKIIAFGDIHKDLGTLAKIREEVGSADLILISGDITNFGDHKDAKLIIKYVYTVNNNILAVMGNLDDNTVSRYLDEIGINLHGKGIIFDNIGIFGCGGSNTTPFNTPTEFSEKQIDSILQNGYKMLKDVHFRIMVSHTPPINTNLDKTKVGFHAGSEAVRSFILKNDIDIVITGHIHESYGIDQLGKTILVNPGAFRDGGYVYIDTKLKDNYVSLKFAK